MSAKISIIIDTTKKRKFFCLDFGGFNISEGIAHLKVRKQGVLSVGLGDSDLAVPLALSQEGRKGSQGGAQGTTPLVTGT